MSTLSDIFDDILSVICPPTCVVCEGRLPNSHSLICVDCFSRISYTRFWEYSENEMSQHVHDLQPFVREASAMLYYDSYSRDMIHRLKYRKEWRTAKFLGDIFGAYLSRSPLYTSVDVVMPVPLHFIRRLERGYNQTEYIARSIASRLGVKCDIMSLRRRRYTQAQAQRSKLDRWEDGEELFEIRGGAGGKRAKSLAGQHILLVDDVYTTGATMFRIIETLKSTIPDCQISIATLATPRG